MVHQVNTEAEFQSAVEADKLTVVDFSAEWCGPCRVIAPYVDQLSKENPEVAFIKVDVDQLEEVAAKQNVTAMPTFQFFRKGNKLAEFRGADKNKLLETLQQLKK